MKAYVDKDTCIGCELCTQICPDVFSMEKDDIAQNLQDDAVEARDSCPVSAIDIEE